VPSEIIVISAECTIFIMKHWYDHPGRHCVGKSAIFDGESALEREAAVWVCARSGGCPVIWGCLEAVIETNDTATVCGATTPRRRAALRRSIRSGAGDVEEQWEKVRQTVRLRVANNGRRPKKWNPRSSATSAGTATVTDLIA
jgi:hypothetical protein